MMRLAAALLVLTSTLALRAGEPLPVEDYHFMLETGWNRDDLTLQYNTFFFRGGTAHELAQEWAPRSSRHQFGYTVPVYSDGRAGLGDATVNYRYQLLGRAASRIAMAPRFTVILPTRSGQFGERSSGLEVGVPFSASLTPRLAAHTNITATWFRERRERELSVAQRIALDLTGNLAVSVDAAYTRCQDDEHLFVVRPGVELTFEGPSGIGVTPGIAFPTSGGVLVYVAFERLLD